ncbi:MAG: polysaccharide deacetylase family protein [Spirochaetales bacterium]|nr:polysaccharide deacetylase family protein [Spirochaetales bacterium]
MKIIYPCFPGGKHKALSLSYDDGRTSDRRLVDILNKSGIKGTFHINSGFLGNEGIISPEEVASLYSGHEVSAHTFSHPTIHRCPKEQIVRQILEDRKRLEDLAGYSVRGLSYPNGSWSKEIVSMLPGLGIEYARVVQTTGNFDMSDDLLTWKTTCHHNNDLLEKAKGFIELNKRQYLYWFSIWGHSYEFDNQGNWDLIEKFCELIRDREDIWYTTVIGMVDYMNAAKRLRVAVSGNFIENPSAQPVWLSVDNNTIEIPGGSTIEVMF